MKVYTKTGDKGKTSLYGGTRVAKSDKRIDAYGNIDELNAYIGWLRDQPVNAEREALLKEIQDRLFTIGSILASSPEKRNLKKPDLVEADVELLESAIDLMEIDLEPLRYFVLPGGNSIVSFCHIARTVCRRAERSIVLLNQSDDVPDLVIQYINRLSDYLFVLSRKLCKELSADEVYWKPRV
jgi:cob(I)alamin adenosyltransferase